MAEQQQQQQGGQQQQQQSAPWYQGVAGVDDAMIGHWKNNGWDSKTPAEVAALATKSWKEAEKFVGAPANEILRLPKEANDPAWRGVFERLGMPKEAKDYDFSAVKRADGTALDDATLDALRAEAHTAGLSKDAATRMAQTFVKRMDAAKSSEDTLKAGKLAEQKTALAKNWGPNFDANKFAASRAAQALGMDPATVSALEGVIGYDKIMDMFLKISTKIGEDKFVSSLNPAAPGVLTRDAAVAKKADLMKDKAWVERYTKGGMAEKNEMTALNIIISGDSESPVRRAA